MKNACIDLYKTLRDWWSVHLLFKLRSQRHTHSWWYYQANYKFHIQMRWKWMLTIWKELFFNCMYLLSHSVNCPYYMIQIKEFERIPKRWNHSSVVKCTMLKFKTIQNNLKTEINRILHFITGFWASALLLNDFLHLL